MVQQTIEPLARDHRGFRAPGAGHRARPPVRSQMHLNRKRGAFAPRFCYQTFELPADVGEGAAVAESLIFGRWSGRIADCLLLNRFEFDKRENKQVRQAPLALEAVRQIDAIFALERDVNGQKVVARTAGACLSPGRGVRDLDALPAAEPVAPCRDGQGHGLHAQALSPASPSAD